MEKFERYDGEDCWVRLADVSVIETAADGNLSLGMRNGQSVIVKSRQGRDAVQLATKCAKAE